MSAIASRWVYSLKLNNPVAKNILAFLASHNFAGDQSCFRIKTICAATEYSERAVRTGLLFLAQNGLIKKEKRFSENGQQLSNEYTLCVPPEFTQEFYSTYGTKSVDKLSGGVHLLPGGGAGGAPPGVQEVHPLNNNKINNNINKSFCANAEQKKNRSEQNQKKHDWAESRNEKAKTKSRQMTQFWGPGHPSYDRLHGVRPG